MPGKPAVSLVAVAGRRRATVDLARRIEREGFAVILVPSSTKGNQMVAFEELIAAFH